MTRSKKVESKKAQPEHEESDGQSVYNVPPSIGLAIGSGRGELLSLTLAELERGEIHPTKELTIELVRLVRDLMKDARKEMERANALAECVEAAKGFVSNARESLSEAMEALEDQEP